jgi:SSS family solute:Na+ symporter
MASIAPLAAVDVAILIVFFLVLVAVGFALSKTASRSLEDYFLGGRRLPWWMLGASTASSNFDMSGTMVIVALVFSLGYRGFLVELRGGVGLALAFALVSVARWLHRSQVMTSAEWMKLRFGTGPQGRMAHQLSAAANVLLSLGMIIYFAKGAGKFVTAFVPIPEVAATAAMVGIGLAYTLASGLYGVVATDLLQMLILVVTSIYVTVRALGSPARDELPAFLTELSWSSPTGAGAADLLATNPAAWGPVYDFFELAVVMWTVRSILEGLSGISGYTDQRFFAAKDERSAVLLCGQSIVLSVFRWALVSGLVVLAYGLVAAGGPEAALIRSDPEQVLPTVLASGLPAGMRGLVIAGLVAAAMSTFDSTLNAGAAFLVRDLYQSYLRPDATRAQLVRASRVATVGLCVLGVGLAALVPSINRVWAWIQMGLGAGLFTPLFLRWYWPRLNGYGFAAGTAAGLAAGVVVNAVASWPVFATFPLVLAVSGVAAVAVARVTPPTDPETLRRFFQRVRPAGAWGAVRRRAVEAGDLTRAELEAHDSDLRRAALVTPFVVVTQLATLLGVMALIFGDGRHGLVLSALVVVGVGGGVGIVRAHRRPPGEPPPRETPSV